MNSSKIKSSAPALTRGLKVLEFLASTDEPQGLTQIAKHLGIAMSSAHSISTTLTKGGYIEKSPKGAYKLTLKVLELANSTIASYDIVTHFHSICDDIGMVRENGATITILDGQDVCFIGARNNPQPLGVTFKPGMRLPACCTASGRALLANLTDEEVKRIYPKEKLPQVTDANLEKRSELMHVLAQVRERGYSDEIAGTRPHMYSYGALVANSRGDTIAGVAIVMFDRDITPEVEEQAIEAVRSLASKLSKFADLT